MDWASVLYLGFTFGLLVIACLRGSAARTAARGQQPTGQQPTPCAGPSWVGVSLAKKPGLRK